MKTMNVGYNPATQHSNNQQNPTAFKACTIRMANDAMPHNSSDLFQATGRVLKHIGREGIKHTKTEVNLAKHLPGQPASLTVVLPDTNISQIQGFIDGVRARFPQDKTGISIELN